MTRIVPNNIANIRKKHGMSQTELARRLDIHISHMNKMERHKKPVTTTTALKISEIFSVTLNDIFLQ